jgi:hypothetical protein
MKKFEPVIDKFKEYFFDGEDMDPECAPTRGRGGRGRGTFTRGGASGTGRGRGAASGASKQNS